MPIAASDIVNLLAEKHAGDVFVGECKTGSTWRGAPLRLDAWAMKRAWARPVTWGYEVKVSRGDFLRDAKHVDYLDYCTDFYFVAPPDIIKRDEVPDYAGLLTTSKNCKRLMTAKKAPHRNVEINSDIYVYILMSRAKIERRAWGVVDGASAEYWRAWLDSKKFNDDLGREVSKRLSEVIQKKIQEVEIENRQLASKNDDYESVRQAMMKLGLDPQHPSRWGVESVLRERAEIITPSLRNQMAYVRDQIDRLLNTDNDIKAAASAILPDNAREIQ